MSKGRLKTSLHGALNRDKTSQDRDRMALYSSIKLFPILALCVAGQSLIYHAGIVIPLPSSMTAPDPSRLNRYLTVIIRWLLITFVVFALTVLCGVTITDNLPKVYTATAQIEILPRGLAAAGTSTTPTPEPDQAEIEIMESPDVLLGVITDLGLDKAWAGRVFRSKEDELTPTEALAYMRKMMKINIVRGTSTIEVIASSDVPQEAAEMANAIADHYKTLRDLRQVTSNQKRDESPVRILSRAEPPVEPSHPNKSFDFLVTIVVAGILSVMAASFVEIVLLLSRASERVDN